MRNLGLASSPGFLMLVLMVDATLAADYSPTDMIFLNCGADYSPTDMIFLNCGGPPHSTDTDGRKWTSDIGSSFALSTINSLTSPAATQKPSVPVVPYMTARIFKSEFAYSFPVASGRKFLRLHFYPASYNGLSASHAIFAVSAGGYTVLRNFSAAQTVEALNVDIIMKEFSINIPGKVFNVTFTPSPNASNSYAFVNGIEVISHPDIYNTDDRTETPVVEAPGMISILDNSTALENVYRLNVGGKNISPSGDTGLFRSWREDTSYLFAAPDEVTLTEGPDPKVTVAFPSESPSYIAPLDVYRTMRTMGPNPTANQRFNLTWVFNIDSGFFYLVRLHFCELKGVITGINQRAFTIFLNNKTAELEADVIAWVGGNGVPVHRDYVVIAPRWPPQQLLRLDMHRFTDFGQQHAEPLLNGVEIFKISDATGNLAGRNPDPRPQPSSGFGKSHKATIVGGGICTLLVVGLLIYLVSRSEGRLPLSLYVNSHASGSGETNTAAESYTSSLPSDRCRRFKITEIKAATNNFDEALVVGVGGFGKVYRGEIDSGTKVAVKRGNGSEQGEREFQTEIEMLSKLRHRNLVSLIGYCEENGEMILVYDYMANGTLRGHLYNTQKPPLPWKQRLEICIGVARGLDYLHDGAEQYTIIHRDVKTSNILLDEKWVPKVSDFGLSKARDHTQVTTGLKGTFGYLDPEYINSGKLTEKSDVYSYGVVLLEIICGRPALDQTLLHDQINLVEYCAKRRGDKEKLLDPYLKGKIASQCLEKFLETAFRCTSNVGTTRPSMRDVLKDLELALQQQSAEESGVGMGSSCKGKK